MDGKKVFVKVEEFKDITDIMTLAHQRLQQARQTLAKIADLKAQEDAEFLAWQEELGEIERRIETIDRHLLGKEEQ
jgi:hypothetical protein